jgi:hypothetical protein
VFSVFLVAGYDLKGRGFPALLLGVDKSKRIYQYSFLVIENPPQADVAIFLPTSA